MTSKEYDNWRNENGVNSERFFANNITYDLVTLKDGWVGIFEVNDYNSERYPQIQACDMAKAKDWCVMRERINVPFNVL